MNDAGFPADADSGPPPSLEHPVSQMCTEAQCLSEIAIGWTARLRQPLRLIRKQWEFAYILQCLALRGKLRAGQRGLVFGAGREPLPALLASCGCRILATDLSYDEAAARGWQDYNSRSRRLESLNECGLCDPATFAQLVEFRELDMNRFEPPRGEFDFVWSSCAFEHLGTLGHGLEFVKRSIECLAPGGVAVHTTEYNLSSNVTTLSEGSTVLYRRRDLEELGKRVRDQGYRIEFNWRDGDDPADRCVDRHPYRDAIHLKLDIAGYTCTSFGLVIDRPMSES